MNALKKEGMTVISSVLPETSEGDKSVVVIILREGYVVARAWPKDKYCALDIHLWSSFEKLEGIEKALLASFESKSSSSYRIVAGGMFGVSTWKQDEKNRGPRFTQLCETPSESSIQDSIAESLDNVDIILEESLSLIQESDVKAIVLCGYESQPCKSQEVLEKNEKITEVIPLLACPNLKDGDEKLKLLIDCEKSALNILLKSVTENKKFHVIVLDRMAPIEMAQVMLRIIRSRRNKARLITSHILVLATMLDGTETWKRNWLDRFRHDVIVREPLYRSEVLFNSSTSSLEMGVTSSGDRVFTKHLVEVVSNIENKTGLLSDVKNIQGGLWEYMEEFKPKCFEPHDYDQSAPLKQWNSQRPVGFQSIFQLEGKRKISAAIVRYAFDNSVKPKIFNDVGDGLLFVSLMSGGIVIVVWDGKKHVDVNIFSYSLEQNYAKRILDKFKLVLPTFEVVLLDEQPR